MPNQLDGRFTPSFAAALNVAVSFADTAGVPTTSSLVNTFPLGSTATTVAGVNVVGVLAVGVGVVAVGVSVALRSSTVTGFPSSSTATTVEGVKVEGVGV